MSRWMNLVAPFIIRDHMTKIDLHETRPHELVNHGVETRHQLVDDRSLFDGIGVLARLQERFEPRSGGKAEIVDLLPGWNRARVPMSNDSASRCNLVAGFDQSF